MTMRILHLEASTGFGGQEIRILREAEGMRARGHSVFLAVMRGAKLGAAAKNEGFVVYEMDFQKKSWPISLFRLLLILRRHQIDLVNTHSSLDAWLGGIAARLGGIAVIRTRHLSTPIKRGWNSRFLYGRLADFVVTTCASIVPTIVNQSGKAATLCRSIPTGVDPSRIVFAKKEADDFRRTWKIPPSDFLVGTVCVMRSWKGIDDLLEAAHLLRDIPDLKWVVVGGGHAERHWERAKQLHLERTVFFTGHLENPFPAMAALDVFALLSTAHEGVSQAILQAAFLKKPLIATSVGGLGEVCLDEKTGLQVPPFSPESVARAVLRLKNEPAFRDQLANRAQLLVHERFTMKQTLDQMEEVYKSLARNRGSSL